MKKYILPAFLLSIATANTSDSIKMKNFNRMYTGVMMNYSKSFIKVKGGDDDTHYTTGGIGGHAIAGIGFLPMDSLYLGAEIALGMSGSSYNGKYKDATDELEANFKSKSRFTHHTCVHIGYAFDSLLLYTKIGYETHGGVKVINTKTNNHVTTINRNGIVLGFGGDWMLTEKIFVRGEYMYNVGGNKKFKEIKINSPTHAFSMGLAYKF